jgi:hypothetical protein
VIAATFLTVPNMILVAAAYVALAIRRGQYLRALVFALVALLTICVLLLTIT